MPDSFQDCDEWDDALISARLTELTELYRRDPQKGPSTGSVLGTCQLSRYRYHQRTDKEPKVDTMYGTEATRGTGCIASKPIRYAGFTEIIHDPMS